MPYEGQWAGWAREPFCPIWHLDVMLGLAPSGACRDCTYHLVFRPPRFAFFLPPPYPYLHSTNSLMILPFGLLRPKQRLYCQAQ